LRIKLPHKHHERQAEGDQVEWVITCANGRKLKLLTVTDEITRESLTVETRTSIKSRAVVEVLEGLMKERGTPALRAACSQIS